MNDALGARMKEQYENRTRYSIPRRTYTIIRLDGKAFHTYTRDCEKPFDKGLIKDFNDAALNVVSQIQGAQFAYVQSDEISILLTDFEDIGTQAWFDGNIQKMASISASLMTAEFNKLRHDRQVKYSLENNIDFAESDRWKLAHFDSRVFTIPDRIEVMNYFIWRNQDCARNSSNMVAQSLYSHKELQGKSQSQVHDMLMEKGINWAEYDESLKNGRLIMKESFHIPDLNPSQKELRESCPRLNFVSERHRWVVKPAWKFTQNTTTLMLMIPKIS